MNHAPNHIFLYNLFRLSGNKDADEVLKILLGNPNMCGGVLACILDNTVPGKFFLAENFARKGELVSR